ncbi:MAG: glycosyltransferase [Thermoplasmata archaeon]|nr:MAG: glycosyltransferase [Thermoplasmata archaeon]
MKVSVVMPTYNEKENIEALIRAVLAQISDDVEVVVVDDDSPDGTWKIVERVGKEMGGDRVRLVRRTDERGLASAVRTGIDASLGDIVVVMDTDFSHPPEKIPELVSTASDADIALGSRHMKGGGMEAPPGRAFFSKLTNLFARAFLGYGVKDYTGGFIAVNKRVFEEVHILDEWGEYGNYCIGFLYTAKEKGYKIKEVPFVYKYRTAGETKTAPDQYNLFRWGKRYCLSILKLRFENL